MAEQPPVEEEVPSREMPVIAIAFAVAIFSSIPLRHLAPRPLYVVAVFMAARLWRRSVLFVAAACAGATFQFTVPVHHEVVS